MSQKEVDCAKQYCMQDLNIKSKSEKLNYIQIMHTVTLPFETPSIKMKAQIYFSEVKETWH